MVVAVDLTAAEIGLGQAGHVASGMGRRKRQDWKNKPKFFRFVHCFNSSAVQQTRCRVSGFGKTKPEVPLDAFEETIRATFQEGQQNIEIQVLRKNHEAPHEVLETALQLPKTAL